MAMTVTATQGGSTSNGILLRVVVLTQAKLAATPATGSQSASSAAASQCAITTTTAGSLVYGALIRDESNTAYTAISGTTLIDNVADTVNHEYYGTFHTTSPTGTPGAITVGSSAPTASSGHGAAAVEILAAGTITTDPSGPAVAETTAAITITTASFTPPPGSLLVAMVSADGGVGVTTMTVSGGGLTWTQQAAGNASGVSYAGVWTAQVPPTSPLQPFRQPVTARPPLPAPGRRYRSVLRPPAIPTSGPPLTPLTAPARARFPLPARGIVRGIAGAALLFSGIGPPVTPLHKPVTAAVRVASPRGRAYGITRAVAKPAPVTPSPLYPLTAPVRARFPLPPRGRALSTPPHVIVAAPTSGPKLTPLHAPVRSRLPLPAPGRAAAIAVVFRPAGATSGPPIGTRGQPVRARPPLPAPGRAMTIAVIFTPVSNPGPAFVPLSQPAGTRVTATRAGHVQSLPGALASGPGPGPAPLYPLRQPVRARLPLPAAGQARTMAVYHAGLQGPAVYALHAPVRARFPLPPRGHRHASVIAPPPPPPTTGPAFVPRHGPVTAIVRVLPRPGRAYAIGSLPQPVTPTKGPSLPPRGRPWRAVIPAPRRGGTAAWTRPGHTGTGPQLTPLTAPVRARQPLPAPGRAAAIIALPLPPGPRLQVPPLGQPAGTRVTFTRGGHVQRLTPLPALLGVPVPPLRQPVRARQPLPPPGRAYAIAPIAPPANITFTAEQGTVTVTTALAASVYITSAQDETVTLSSQITGTVRIENTL